MFGEGPGDAGSALGRGGGNRRGEEEATTVGGVLGEGTGFGFGVVRAFGADAPRFDFGKPGGPFKWATSAGGACTGVTLMVAGAWGPEAGGALATCAADRLELSCSGGAGE